MSRSSCRSIRGRLLRSAVFVAACGALLLFAAPRAHAYPHWQFSSGTAQCSTCHFSPSGGGLITSYGRDQAADELSTFQGNGDLLHGVIRLPSWFSLGGDVRGAAVVNEVQNPGGPQFAYFPMQAELYAQLDIAKGVSLYGSGGLRGRVRKEGELVPTQNYQPVTASRLVSREHYAMWQSPSSGHYVRAGRFHAPFGLRLAEHVFYVRRDLGFNLMEETYNLSGGYLDDAWELHVTAFAPDYVRHMGGTEKGGAAYFERRILDDTGALGAQTKLAFGVGSTRVVAGAVAKLYVESLETLFLAEANFVHNEFSSIGSTNQLVGIAGASWLPARGVVVSLFGERNQSDVRVRDAAWNAATGTASWFPFAHLELQVVGRVQLPSGGDPAQTLLAQIHYFL